MSHPPSLGPTLGWLKACYFFFFSILGLLVPYLGVFFEARGFNPQEIGVLLAIVLGTRIIAPNVWAWIADRTGMRAELIKLGAFFAAISFVSFFYESSFTYLALSLVIYTFFWNAILAQLEVVTLETLDKNAHQYGGVRSWGSVGYIVVVIFGGIAIDALGAQILPYIGIVLFLGLAFCAAPLPSHRVVTPKGTIKPKFTLGKSVSMFLFSAMLLQMSVGPFYGFFVLYLKQIGYSETVAGILVALGVLAEIAIFVYASRMISRFGLKSLLILSTLLTAARWFLLAFWPEQVALLTLSQLLHAFTFGLTHAVSIQFIHRHIGIAHRSRGQALYASLSFGVGGAIGSWVSGIIWGDGATSYWIWIFATGCALLSAVIVYFIPNMEGNTVQQKE